ncbi:hypothetical protein MY11210_001019 [Beauveria gryllotalpidicola]
MRAMKPLISMAAAIAVATVGKKSVTHVSEPPYDARLDSYWSLSAVLRPWCMVLPSSAEDVSVIIKILVEHHCHFGIRAGGHGGFPLSNSVQRVTIDLESHRQACDNVANSEVVLASGEIVNANASSNRDLWQALKGSSGNLSLATRLDMYGIEYADPAKAFSSAILAWMYNPEAEAATLIHAIFANTAAKVKPAAFDGFYSADGMLSDDTRVANMTQLVRELSISQVAGNHNAWYTSAFQNDARPMRYAVEISSKLIKELEEVAPSSTSRLNIALYLQSLSKSMTDKGIQKGGNVIALDRFTDKSNGILMLVLVTVKDAESEKLLVPRLETFLVSKIPAAANKYQASLVTNLSVLNMHSSSLDAGRALNINLVSRILVAEFLAESLVF